MRPGASGELWGSAPALVAFDADWLPGAVLDLRGGELSTAPWLVDGAPTLERFPLPPVPCTPRDTQQAG